MPTVTGGNVSYDRGAFRLYVDYSISDSGITVCPYVKLSSGGFGHDHTAVFSCKAFPNGKNLEEAHVREAKYKAKEKKKTVWKDVKYYAAAKKEKKKTVKQDTYGKVKVKTKSGKTKTVKKWHVKKETEKVDWGGKSFSYKGTSLKVSVYMKAGGGVKKSGVSEVTVKTTEKPWAPDGVYASRIAGGSATTQARIYTNGLQASYLKPLTSLTFERLQEDPTKSQWQTVGSKSVPYGETGLGDIKVAKKITSGSDLYMDDYGLSTGSRYLFRITANNANGGSSKTSGWYYTTPPAVSNVSHVRLDDKTNIIYFSRDPRNIIMNIVKGFKIQCNTRELNDPNFASGWKDINKDSDYVGYAINPGESSPDTMSTKYTNVAIKHKNCSADTRYRYRIAAYNFFDGASNDLKSYSDYSATNGDDPTYNTPMAPKSTSAAPNADITEVTVKIVAQKAKSTTSTGSTADKVYIQRKIENGSWSDVGESDGIDINSLAYVDTKNGPTYTYIDTDILDIIGKTVQYRAAFGCSQTTINGQPPTSMMENHGKSAWSTGTEMALLAKPNKPNLIMPVNNQKIASDTPSVRMAWVHSPKDGTPQKAVELQIKRNSGAWTSIALSSQTTAFHDLPLIGYQPNDVVYWRVRTKGEHKDFSDWNQKSFKVLARPTLSITSITDMSEISILPLKVAYDYADLSGELSSLTLNIEQDDDVIKSYEIDFASLETPNEYVLSDYIFDDDSDYTLALTAVSTSGLDVVTRVNITIKYTKMRLTKGFDLIATFDEDTGCSSVSIERTVDDVEQDAPEVEPSDEDDEDDIITSDARVKQIYLYRLYENDSKLVDDPITVNLDDYDSATSFNITDKFCPINSDFEYKLLQVTELGEVSVSIGNVEHYETLWWYVYYGGDQVIKTRWNPQSSVSLGRPERQEVRYSGREYPVLYDSTANEETVSYSFALVRDDLARVYDSFSARETLDQFKDMMRNGGHGIWKSFEGDVFYAKFDFSYSSNYAESGVPQWSCSLSVSRIDEGGGL